MGETEPTENSEFWKVVPPLIRLASIWAYEVGIRIALTTYVKELRERGLIQSGKTRKVIEIVFNELGIGQLNYDEVEKVIGDLYHNPMNGGIPFFLLIPLACKIKRGEVNKRQEEKELEKFRKEFGGKKKSGITH